MDAYVLFAKNYRMQINFRKSLNMGFKILDLHQPMKGPNITILK